MAAKTKGALKRKGCFVPEAEIQHKTIEEIISFAGDPREGQGHRVGKGEDQVDLLWDYKALAVEIHDSAQATMMSSVKIELCKDKDTGKIVRLGGNRTILALQLLKNTHGDKPVKVVVETDLDGRPLKLTHEKDYSVKFPVRYYGELTKDQQEEIGLRDERARKDASKADYYFQGYNLLKGSMTKVPEKVFVKRMGAGRINRFFPKKVGLKKDGTEYKPAITFDANGEIEVNNREAIQTCYRLLELPEFVAEAFIDGEAGEGPKIQKRLLSSKLIPAFEADQEKVPAGKLTKSMSLPEIKKLFPESELVATMEQALKAKGPRGPKAKAAFSGKELKGHATIVAGSRILFIHTKLVSRDVGFVSEPILSALMTVAVQAEKLLGAEHPAWKALDDALAAEKAAAASGNEEDEEDFSDEEEPSDEDESSDEAE